MHYNQRCYRYQVNNKIIITYIKYQEKECTSIDNKNVRQVKSRMYSKLSTKKNIYEQQEEQILNNLLLVSLTRTEYEYRCVFQQVNIFYASLG